MSKTMFETLAEMHRNDCNNKTATVGVCDYLIEAKKVKGGGHVTMGVPEDVVYDLFLDSGKKIPILLIVDKAEYDKIKNSQNG